jgi:hypothetical protein
MRQVAGLTALTLTDCRSRGSRPVSLSSLPVSVVQHYLVVRIYWHQGRSAEIQVSWMNVGLPNMEYEEAPTTPRNGRAPASARAVPIVGAGASAGSGSVAGSVSSMIVVSSVTGSPARGSGRESVLELPTDDEAQDTTPRARAGPRASGPARHTSDSHAASQGGLDMGASGAGPALAGQDEAGSRSSFGSIVEIGENQFPARAR